MKNVSVGLALLVLAILIVLPVVSNVNELPNNKLSLSPLLFASGSPLPGPQPPPPVLTVLSASGSPLPGPQPPPPVFAVLSASGSPLPGPQPPPPVAIA
jgi:hypothetical protein